jgi:hypothetical protein
MGLKERINMAIGWGWTLPASSSRTIATCFFFENDGDGRELLRFLWFGFSDRTASFRLDLGLATSLVRFRFLLWFGFDSGVDLVLIGFEWPDLIWVLIWFWSDLCGRIRGLRKTGAFGKNLLPLELWVCGWWVSVGSWSPVQMEKGERGSGTVVGVPDVAAMGLGGLSMVAMASVDDGKDDENTLIIL